VGWSLVILNRAQAAWCMAFPLQFGLFAAQVRNEQ
jgi:hypothetical protein